MKRGFDCSDAQAIAGEVVLEVVNARLALR